MALGANAAVGSDASGGTALGQNAKITQGATNAVALEKIRWPTRQTPCPSAAVITTTRITNLADGVNDSDAVNVSQVSAVKSDVSANSTAIANEAKTRAAADETPTNGDQ